jgi:hypothetical protein
VKGSVDLERTITPLSPPRFTWQALWRRVGYQNPTVMERRMVPNPTREGLYAEEAKTFGHRRQLSCPEPIREVRPAKYLPALQGSPCPPRDSSKPQRVNPSYSRLFSFFLPLELSLLPSLFPWCFLLLSSWKSPLHPLFRWLTDWFMDGCICFCLYACTYYFKRLTKWQESIFHSFGDCEQILEQC